MKRLILIFLFVAVGLGAAFAGNAGDKEKKDRAEMKKELRDFKLKFVAQEIELRDDQRSKFTDAYSRMMSEEEVIWEDLRVGHSKVRNGKGATDADYEQANAAVIESKARMAALEKKYDAVFAKFLTPSQRFKLKDAEMKFRREMERMCAKKDKKHKKK